MATFNDIIVNFFLPAFKGVGKAELAKVLEKIQLHNTIEVYTNTLKSINSSFSLLKEVAIKSNTKIDDGLVDLVLEAVRESAAADGIAL